MAQDQKSDTPGTRGSKHDHDSGGMPYLRFGAMIGTSMVFMFIVMYLNTFELDHLRWSETRLFMTLLMGATMAVIMLGFMLPMYRNRRANVAIVLGGLVLFGLATWLVRSQATVQETSYMNAMIPHLRLPFSLQSAQRSKTSGCVSWRWRSPKPNVARSPRWNG